MTARPNHRPDNPLTPHTAWCGRGHHCGLNEHRSKPTTWTPPYGVVVAALVQPTSQRHGYLELRIQVRIDPSEATARRQAADIAVDVDAAIRRIARRYATRPVTQ